MNAESTAPRVHPSAVVGGGVELGSGVEVGPFCLLDGRIRIGARTRLIGHVTILGDTEIGADNVLQVVENGTTSTLDLDPAQDFVGHDFSRHCACSP